MFRDHNRKSFEQEVLEIMREERDYLKDIARDFNRFLRILLEEINKQPTTMSISFNGEETMDTTLVLVPVTPQTAVATENNADGSVFVFNPLNLEWSAEDETIINVSKNTDGSALVTPLKAGVTQLGVADTATGLSALATVTVTGGTVTGPTSMVINWNPTISPNAVRKV